MLSCEQFQFLAGADPRHLTWSQRLHRLMCRTCGRYLESMRELDHRIEDALEIDVTDRTRPPAP